MEMENRVNSVHRVVSELCDDIYGDTLGLNGMLIDITVAHIEVILKFKRYVMPKIQDMTTVFNALKLDLDAAKLELGKKEEKLKIVSKCFKCPTLEKELNMLKKKQAVHESRIKSIANILTRCIPATQDPERPVYEDSDDNSDQSTVTKAYNLVSQMFGVDTHSDIENELEVLPESKGTKRQHCYKTSPLESKDVETYTCKMQQSISQGNSGEKEALEDDILVCSVVEVDKENDFEMFLSPKKTKESIRSISSPVLGKNKKFPLKGVDVSSPVASEHNMHPAIDKLQDCDSDNSFFIPPSPGNVGNSRNTVVFHLNNQAMDNRNSTNDCSKGRNDQFYEERPKKVADFWQLKTSFVDCASTSSKRHGTKLKQAKLSLGSFPKKVDICDLQEFNGGIRKSQTSTQISDKPEKVAIGVKTNLKLVKCFDKEFKSDDEVVLDSPDNICTSRQKGGRKKTVFGTSGRKLFSDVDASSTKRSNGNPSSHSTDNKKALGNSKYESQQEIRRTDDSFDSMKKCTTSPKYKYRGETVRKKSERQKLPGWDCENCKKYYEAVGGENMCEEELKKLMNHCSRHRDKHPLRPNTPPGFWDADFPSTPECDALNRTCMDILPLPKKQKTK